MREMEKISDWLWEHEPIIHDIISALCLVLSGASLAISIIGFVSATK